MPRSRSARLALVAALVLGLPAPGMAAGRFDLGVADPISVGMGAEKDVAGAYRAAASAHFAYVRIGAVWSAIAPTRPAHPTDPTDPAYDWSSLASPVQRALDEGMRPLVYLYAPPEWAKRHDRSGTPILAPRPADFAAFAAAAARRFDGAGGGPLVRYWEVWNEPDLFSYFRGTPSDYRVLANGAADAIHAAIPGSLVAAGSLAPFSYPNTGIHALEFMRDVLCLSDDATPVPTCGAKLHADAWSVHPYTSGGPDHKGSVDGFLSLGDLPKARALLRAAERAGHFTGRRPPQFWVTEFAWDTDGPDPGGVPLARHARWVAEALYRSWRQGVSLFCWFALRDNPADGDFPGTFQDGLYFRTQRDYAGERRKPFAQVIGFPFAAVPVGRRVAIWGRTPLANRSPVTIERRVRGSWRVQMRLRPSAGGVFERTVSGLAGAVLRARTGRTASRPYTAVANVDVPVNPFG